MKKLVFSAFSMLILLMGMLTVIVPSSATAAGNTFTGTNGDTYTVRWINAFQLQAVDNDTTVKHPTYIFMSQTQSTLRGSAKFTYTSDENSWLPICTSNSDYFDGVNAAGTQATFHCNSNSTTVSIGNTAANSAYFNYKNSSTINTGNGRREFDFSGDSTANTAAVNSITVSFNNSTANFSTPAFKYIYGENGGDLAVSNKSKCVSAIAIDTAATNADGSIQDKNPNAFLVVSDDKSNPSLDSYPSFVGSRLSSNGWVNSGLDPNGCSYSKPIPIYVNNVSAGPTASNQPTTGPSGGTPAAADACSTTGGSYAWILCPIVTSAGTFLNGVYEQAIEPLLSVTPLNSASDGGLNSVWKALVGLADVVFVIVFLVMIFGTSFGLDSYTVKKTLPRLVIAAIAIQLSYFLCGIVVDIGNVFGAGIDSLITNTLSLSTSTLANGAAPTSGLAQSVVQASATALLAMAGIGTAIAAVALLGPTTLLLILSLALSVLVFVFTLLVRKVLIDVLIILAPLAIVAWVLPNTQSLFKKWLQTFIRIIMVYPIISLMLGAAAIVQKVGGVSGGFTAQLVGGLAPIVVFFMMPMAFKWGGTAMALAGTVATKSGLGAGAKAAGAGGKAPFKKAWSDTKANRAANSAAKLNERSSGTGFGATAAKFRLGGFATGAAATMRGARVSSEQEKLEKQQQDAYARQYKGMDLTELGGKAEGFEGDSPQMRAAVAEMAEQYDTEGLDKIFKSGKFEGGADNAAWKKAMRGVSGDVIAKAPHLAGVKYSGITAEKLSKLNKTGTNELVSQMKAHRETLRNATATADQKADAKSALQSFDNALKTLTPGNRGTISKDDVGKIINAGAGDIFDAAGEERVIGSTEDLKTIIDSTTGAFLPPPPKD